MATIVEGDIGTFDAFVYGLPHPGTVEFIRTQMTAPSRLLEQASSSFQRNLQSMYESFAGDDTIRRIKALTRTVHHMWDRDNVSYLESMGELQQAKPTMQRFIMASPYVRKLYNAQKIEGYSGSYVDVYAGDVGRDHCDYRRVMSGVVEEFETEDGETSWKAMTWFDDPVEGDLNLTLSEKVDIIETWDVVKAHILRKREDPTSPYNASLG